MLLFDFAEIGVIVIVVVNVNCYFIGVLYYGPDRRRIQARTRKET